MNPRKKKTKIKSKAKLILQKSISETEQISEKNKRAEGLLNTMLPKSVTEHLLHGEHVDTEDYESVTIFFSDIKGEWRRHT